MAVAIETITCPECKKRFKSEATIGMPNDKDVTCNKCGFRFTLGDSRGYFEFSDKLKFESTKKILDELAVIRKEVARQEYRTSFGTVAYSSLLVLCTVVALAGGNKLDVALVGIFAIALRPIFMK